MAAAGKVALLGRGGARAVGGSCPRAQQAGWQNQKYLVLRLTNVKVTDKVS